MGAVQPIQIAPSSEQSSNQTLLEPMEVITRQTCSEGVEIIRGKDGDRPAWHVILVSYEKVMAFQRKNFGSLIQVEHFGRNIEYRDKAGVVCQASGYGTTPPEQLMKWINENYDPCTTDENTSLTYVSDDIRLCTIQRDILKQPLSIFLRYHRHERFHYLKLSDDYGSVVDLHAGIKPFDRVIEYKGINIEGDSAENLKKRIDDTDDQLFQLLVCSPATYAHYRENNKHIYSHLNTVKRPESSQDTTNTTNNYESLENADTLGQTTLMNSDPPIDRYTFANFQEIDNNEFHTACQYSIVDTIAENKSVLSDKRNGGNPQKDDGRERKEQEKQESIQQLTVLLDDDRNNTEIHHAQCGGCGSLRIYNDRYRCLECDNYDLCGRCFDQRCETLKHINGHAMVYFSDPGEIFGEPVIDINTTVTLSKFKETYSMEIHTNFGCNNCKTTPIKGLRFKCVVCHNHDLCITCMETREHDRSHPLIAIGKNLEIPMDDIELHGELGRGGFGTVYKAKWLSRNREVACKVISVTPGHEHLEKSFRKELIAYAELSGPYILKTYGYNMQEWSNGIRKCMLVMEFMHRGSLSSVLRQKEKLPLRRKLEMACQIASGMRKLHAHRMIHRDIRPDNILVTQDYTAKLGDMGLARVLLPDDNLTLIGCMGYMPLDFYTGKYDQSLDVYTFGLTINELFTEKRHQFNALTRRIKLTNPSPVFADLIARCIHNVPSQRPSAIEIETTLQMYKQAFEKYVLEKNINYSRMPIEVKNSTFITIYDALHPEINEILKHKFSSVSSAGGLATGINNEDAEILRLLELLQHLGDH